MTSTTGVNTVEQRTVVHLHAGEVVIDDDQHVPVTGGQSPHSAAIAWIASNRATLAAKPIPVRAYEDGGTIYDFLVYPDGTLGDMQQVEQPAVVPQRQAEPQRQQVEPQRQATEPARSGDDAPPAMPDAAPAPSAQPPSAPTATAEPIPNNNVTTGGASSEVPELRDHARFYDLSKSEGGELNPYLVVADPTRSEMPIAETQPNPDHPEHEQQQEQEPAPRRALSFLDDTHPGNVAVSAPPLTWWQRLFGVTPKGPSPEEVALERDIRAVSQPWLGPRCVAVVNGKGGAGKTPTAVLLAAVFALFGGGPVAGWDNNETRGTMGWRTEQSPHHDATVQDLIPFAQELMDSRAALSRISSFVHHQTADKFDVLRSDPALLAAEQRLTTEQFLAVYEVMKRYFRLTIMDSSNDESSYNYLNMLDAADQIVVPTTTAPDHAEAGRLLLEALWARGDEHSKALARNAVVIVAQADREEADAELVAARFREMVPAEAVITVPYDSSIRQMQLRYNNLAPATQRSYLRAAAEVAERLNQS